MLFLDHGTEQLTSGDGNSVYTTDSHYTLKEMCFQINIHSPNQIYGAFLQDVTMMNRNWY